MDFSFSLSPPSPPPPSSAEKKRKQRVRKKKTTTSRMVRFSTSSAESGLFSDELEETETLVSFSTDSSSDIFARHLATIRETTPRRRKKNKSKVKRSVSSRRSGESESPARLSVFQRLIPCTVDGKVRESFAVVKKSEDPYEDFKRSMMEMIVEKHMFDEKELEQLLHCFLSLNSREHHRVIVQAFSEIWEGLFCASSARSSSSGAKVNF